MDQLIRCPICDHAATQHLATGCEGLGRQKCRCKLTANAAREKAVILAQSVWTKHEHVPGTTPVP
jgi:hypothetical protein